MSLIVKKFNHNELVIRSLLNYWNTLGNIRPVQGIAMLIGFLLEEVTAKPVLNQIKNNSDDMSYFNIGVPLLKGGQICSWLDLEQSDECIQLNELYSIQCDKYLFSLESSTSIFAISVQSHRRAYQCWKSDIHKHPDVTPLSYFLEWWKSKGKNPEWIHIAVGLDQIKGDASVNNGKQPETAPPYSTAWLNIQQAAIAQFFNPRRNPDAKRDEVIEWIKQQAEVAGLPESNNTATSIFTIIKLANHDPKKKRGEPQ